MSLTLEEINMIVNASVKDAETKKAILEEAQQLEQDKKEERQNNKGPKAKNKFVVLIRGDASLKPLIQQAWVVQRKENADNSTLIENIKEVARESNNTQKRKKRMANAFREVFQYVQRKYWKPKDIMVKTKEPVEVVIIEKEYINE